MCACGAEPCRHALCRLLRTMRWGPPCSQQGAAQQLPAASTPPPSLQAGRLAPMLAGLRAVAVPCNCEWHLHNTSFCACSCLQPASQPAAGAAPQAEMQSSVQGPTAAGWSPRAHLQASPGTACAQPPCAAVPGPVHRQVMQLAYSRHAPCWGCCDHADPGQPAVCSQAVQGARSCVLCSA